MIRNRFRRLSLRYWLHSPPQTHRHVVIQAGSKEFDATVARVGPTVGTK